MVKFGQVDSIKFKEMLELLDASKMVCVLSGIINLFSLILVSLVLVN